MVSFSGQKLLGLIRFHPCIFAFIFFVLGDRSKKNIARIFVKEHLPEWSPLKRTQTTNVGEDVWRKGKPSALLVAMPIDAANVKNDPRWTSHGGKF